MILRILFEKPGMIFTKNFVDIPIILMDNEEIRYLLDMGYHYAGAKVI